MTVLIYELISFFQKNCRCLHSYSLLKSFYLGLSGSLFDGELCFECKEWMSHRVMDYEMIRISLN